MKAILVCALVVAALCVTPHRHLVQQAGAKVLATQDKKTENLFDNTIAYDIDDDEFYPLEQETTSDF